MDVIQKKIEQKKKINAANHKRWESAALPSECGFYRDQQCHVQNFRLQTEDPTWVGLVLCKNYCGFMDNELRFLLA